MEQETKQSKIPGTERLLQEVTDKYVVYLCFGHQKCSFFGYIPNEENSFFYQETSFPKGKSFTESFKEFYFRNEYFTFPFKQVTIMQTSRYYTLVPTEAYDPSKIKDMLSFAFSGSIGKALCQSLPEMHAELIYSIPDDLFEFCSRSFLGPEFRHHMGSLLSVLLKQSKAVYPKQLAVFVRDSEIDIIGTHKGELIFANSFPSEDTNDSIYYILAVWKQLEMDQLEEQLLLFGRSDEVASLKKTLQSYLQHINSIEIPNEVLAISPDIQQLPFDLISLLTCEL